MVYEPTALKFLNAKQWAHELQYVDPALAYYNLFPMLTLGSEEKFTQKSRTVLLFQDVQVNRPTITTVQLHSKK